MEFTDGYGRKINYLRLSVTDRCNMRCIYCMPAEGVELCRHHDVLSYEALLRIARAAVEVGIEKIRITGGEPLVRKGLLPFLQELSALPGLRQLVLTTNGLALPEMAGALREAGVQRLNISLDSLHPATFAAITRGADLQRVLAGIDAAEAAGLPLKLNMVVMAGINDGELLDFVELTLQRKLTVRFIEYMPSLRAEDWEARVVSGETILARIAARYPFIGEDREGLAGPARTFRIAGAAGTFGIITPVTGHFCAECNRIRVTAVGTVRSCLFGEDGLDLKPILAQNDAGLLVDSLRSVIRCKPKEHALLADEPQHDPFAMAAIGG